MPCLPPATFLELQGDDCRPRSSLIYAPHANKHAYAIHTGGVFIGAEQHVFSARALHLLGLVGVTGRCSDAGVVDERGKGFC